MALSNHPNSLGGGSAAVQPAQIASGSAAYAVGDILYANTTNTLALLPAGTSGKLLSTQGAGAAPIWVAATGGAGDVNGPASATDNAIVRFDGTGGKTVQNSGVTIDDSNNLAVGGQVTLSTTTDNAGADIQYPVAPSGTAGSALNFSSYTNIATFITAGRIKSTVIDGSASYDSQMAFAVPVNAALTTHLTMNEGVVKVTTSTVSSSTTTGALVVTGGTGVGGALNVGGNLTVGTGTSSFAGALTVGASQTTGSTITGSDAGSGTAILNLNEGVGNTLQFRIMGTGVLRANLGSAAAPIYTFDGDPDTGIFRSSADVAGLTAGGVPAAYWAADSFFGGAATTGAFSMPRAVGSVAAPAYSFVGDADTGFYRNTANEIGFASGGSPCFFASGQALRVAANTAFNAGGTAGSVLLLGNSGSVGVYFGSGAPTISGGQGSLYIRSDGSSTSTRLYVNTNGSTTWTNVTTAA